MSGLAPFHQSFPKLTITLDLSPTPECDDLSSKNVGLTPSGKTPRPVKFGSAVEASIHPPFAAFLFLVKRLQRMPLRAFSKGSLFKSPKIVFNRTSPET